MRAYSKRNAFLFASAAVVALAGCVVSRNPITGNKRAYGYSWQQEVELGRNADAQIQSQYGLYQGPDLAQYVDSLGQALVEVSHLRRPGAESEWQATKFYFRVLDSPVVNAFALPGGFVYVTRGLLAHLGNEAQLAVVLGHEIGHVAGRHASKRAAGQLFGQALLLGGAIGGQLLLGGNAASEILNYGSAATQLLFLRYGRDDEREADRVGVEYAAMGGYDAAHGADFFRTLKRLGQQSENDIPSFLSTHPDPGEREATIGEQAAIWAARLPSDKVKRANYFSRIDGMVFGHNPRQGFVRDGRFYHPDMAFEFPVPAGFQVNNKPQQVVLFSGDQKAALIMEIDSEHATAREAASALSTTEGLRVVESGIGNANGLSARYVVADMQISKGKPIRLRAHFVDYNDSVYSFLGFALKDDFGAYDGYFQTSMRGFRRLIDASILAIEPNRIDIQVARDPSTFQSALPTPLPPGVSSTMLAILNQLELSDVLVPGQMFKLVR